MYDTEKWESLICMHDLPVSLHNIANTIGIEATIKLLKCEGGTRVYLPKADSIARRIRDRQIREAYDGYNSRQLAKQFNLSEMHIQSIIKNTEQENMYELD